MSTINRMLRTRDRMHDLYATSQKAEFTEPEKIRLLAQVDRVERQAELLLRALRFIYISLSGFAAAVLMTLIGASLAHYQNAFWFRALSTIGLLLGIVAVSSLVIGCSYLLRATYISLANIRDEATVIRERHKPALKSL